MKASRIECQIPEIAHKSLKRASVELDLTVSDIVRYALVGFFQKYNRYHADRNLEVLRDLIIDIRKDNEAEALELEHTAPEPGY